MKHVVTLICMVCTTALGCAERSSRVSVDPDVTGTPQNYTTTINGTGYVASNPLSIDNDGAVSVNLLRLSPSNHTFRLYITPVMADSAFARLELDLRELNGVLVWRTIYDFTQLPDSTCGMFERNATDSLAFTITNDDGSTTERYYYHGNEREYTYSTGSIPDSVLTALAEFFPSESTLNGDPNGSMVMRVCAEAGFQAWLEESLTEEMALLYRDALGRRPENLLPREAICNLANNCTAKCINNPWNAMCDGCGSYHMLCAILNWICVHWPRLCE